MDIINIEDQEDGSAIMSVNLSQEELVTFAKIGLLKVLTDSANDAIAEHGEG